MPQQWSEYVKILIRGWQEGSIVLPDEADAGRFTSGLKPDREGRTIAAAVRTSGTTGRARTVLLTAEGLLSGALLTAVHQLGHEIVDPPGRVPSLADALRLLRPAANSMNFVTTMLPGSVAALNIMLRAMTSGQQLTAICDRDPRTLFEALRTTETPVSLGVDPLYARSLLRYMRNSADSVAPIKDVFAVVVGGSRLPSQTAAELEDMFGAPVMSGYGMAELGGPIAIGKLNDPGPTRWTTVGTPLPSLEIELRQQAETAVANHGILLCKSPTLMWGYAGEDQVDRIQTEPWFNTGDVFELTAARELVYRGRAGDEIVRGGRHIDVHAIEEFMEQHPAVSAASCHWRPFILAGRN